MDGSWILDEISQLENQWNQPVIKFIGIFTLDDSLTWKAEKNGIFSVKSCYSMLQKRVIIGKWSGHGRCFGHWATAEANMLSKVNITWTWLMTFWKWQQDKNQHPNYKQKSTIFSHNKVFNFLLSLQLVSTVNVYPRLQSFLLEMLSLTESVSII